MRCWGRKTDELGNKTWVAVETDANGLNDGFYITALAQCLRLNLSESPMYANAGIPQYQTIMTQTYPDFYVSRIQQQYSQYFASLTITRVAGVTSPQYNARAVLHSGAVVNQAIPT